MNRRLFAAGIACLVLMLASVLAYTKMHKAAPEPSSGANSGDYGSAGSVSARAKELEAKGELLEARNLYQKLTNDFPGASLNELSGWQKKIEDLNIKLLFSAILTPNAVLYEIKPGDTLIKISREFKTTPELIIKSNNLTGDKIVPGRKIKVWTVPFSILVDKSQNTLLLKANEEVIKSYTVSTGKNNCTPVGVFKIINKLPNPTWFKSGAVVPADSPENILGSRWLGFDLPGYGIHGTTDPKSLGTQATQGCVRMSNTEVEELYTIVPAGTEVTIVD
ncbi:MAG TPA: L,D-transpeptidase family protein [Patescibacteria group bacterium]|nr:L,D-transpeptidase family protein [Patescibacteria group bacterium]